MSVSQKLVFRKWLVGLTFALLTANTGYTTGQREKRPTLVIESASLSEPDIFNVRFKKVDIRAHRIWDVILSLAEAIEKSSGNKRRFEVFLESGRTGKYLDKHIPTSRWVFSGPKIDFTASDVTLEAIIDAVCLKAGWSYDDHTPVGTMFTDSKRLPKPKR